MADDKQPKPEKPISRDFKTGIAVGVIALAIVAIGVLNYWGNPENVIHRETASSAIWVIVLVLMGIGIAGGVPLILDKLGK